MNIHILAAAATASAVLALPALAGGGLKAQGQGAAAAPAQHQHHQLRSQGSHGGAPSRAEGVGYRSQPHPLAGGSREDQRPDPNYQNPYRPMFSLDATNPGEPHPYYRTRKDGFGYPVGPAPVYLGNGVYVIPR